jgi:hypothetical protein
MTGVDLTALTDARLKRVAAKAWMAGEWELTDAVIRERARRTWVDAVAGLDAVSGPACVVRKAPKPASYPDNWARLQGGLSTLVDDLLETATSQYPDVHRLRLKSALQNVLPSSEAEILAPLRIASVAPSRPGPTVPAGPCANTELCAAIQTVDKWLPRKTQEAETEGSSDQAPAQDGHTERFTANS